MDAVIDFNEDVAQDDAPRKTATFHEQRMNVGWTRKYSQIAAKIEIASLMLNGTPRPDMGVGEIQAYQVSKLEAIESLYQLVEESTGHVAKILKSVPREWLSEDAPKKLDWSKAASQDWLMPEYQALISADIQRVIQDSQKKAMKLLKHTAKTS